MNSENKISYVEIILKTVAVTGLLSVALIAPNALTMFKLFSKKKYKPQQHINRKITYMIEKGYLAVLQKEGCRYVTLTNLGKKELLRCKIRKSKPTQVWDKKWKVVIFDIKESARSLRNQLRNELSEFGFVKLQHSVWITPYDCEDYITLLKADLRIGKSVMYMKVQFIDNEDRLKKIFSIN